MLITPLTLQLASRWDASFPILKLFWKVFPSITCFKHGWVDHPIFSEKADWKENPSKVKLLNWKAFPSKKV